MKIEPIDYSASYESVDSYGLKRWEKIGIGATITESDDPIQCLQELKNKVEQFHRESNKTLSIVADNVPVPIVQVEKEPETKLTKEEKQKKFLIDCITIDELNSFRLLVKNNPHLRDTYDLRLEQLQQLEIQKLVK